MLCTYTKEYNQFYKSHRDKITQQFPHTKQWSPKRITITPHVNVHVYALPADSVRTHPYVFNHCTCFPVHYDGIPYVLEAVVIHYRRYHREEVF